MGLPDIADNFGKSAAKKVVVDRLKALMAKYKVSPDMQRMVVFAVDNSVEYVDLCVKTRKKPDDPKVLTEFLISKGVFTAKMASDDLGCAVSLVEFANNLRKNVPKAKGFVPAALVVSLTALDVLAVGNSCQFVQEAYYHAFLETSTPHVSAIPRRTDIRPATDPVAFLTSVQPQDRVRCEAERQLNHAAKFQALPLSMP
jgi:hypothetical protein